MKRFEFHLASALNWRSQRLAAEKARLEDLLGRRIQIRNRIEASGLQWEKSRENTLSKATISAFDLSALDSFRRALDHERARLENEMSELDLQIEGQRKKVVEADRQCRLLEKLRDRRYAEWRKLAEREWEKEASDLYLAKWNREP